MNANNEAPIIMSTNDEEMQNDHGYGDAAPSSNGPRRSSSNIRVSALPKSIQQSARMLVEDISGELGPKEVANAITNLEKKGKQNRNLKRAIATFVALTLFMIAAVFAASITAARLSQQLTVSPNTGFAYAKGSDIAGVMKTGEAVEYLDETSVGEMSNEELLDLKEMIFLEGDLRFVVKGHARDSINDTVVLLVEGGTITFGRDHLVSSTGSAKMLFEAIFGDDAHVEGSDGNRKLHTRCAFPTALVAPTSTKKRRTRS